MAGRARRQALSDELEKRTRHYFDIDAVDVAIGAQSVPTHLEYVCAQVECGTSLTRQAEALGKAIGFDLSYERLMAYLRQEFGREAVDQAMREARSRASHKLAEDSIAISDEDAETSVAVARAGNRLRSRQWVAGRWNPQQYGQSQQTNVSISLTSLHLTALQAAPAVVTGSIQQAPVAVQSPSLSAPQVTPSQEVA